MNKFKVGDIVQQNKYGLVNYGEQAIVEEYTVEGVMTIKWISGDLNLARTNWDEDFFLKVESKKKVKEQPVVKHVILKDSCGNYERITNSLKEAEDYLKGLKIREAYTIYELVAVERLSPNIKIERLAKKRGKKK